VDFLLLISLASSSLILLPQICRRDLGGFIRFSAVGGLSPTPPRSIAGSVHVTFEHPGHKRRRPSDQHLQGIKFTVWRLGEWIEFCLFYIYFSLIFQKYMFL
jgi:hypothetical protein